jgi:hypothetical protein
MSKGPSKVGTQTTTTDSTPWNSDYLTGLYDNAGNAYDTMSTAYQDPSLKDTYNKLLWSGDTIDQTLRPQSYGAWNNAVSGGLGVTNSPVYWDLYNLGKGQTNTQLGLDVTADRLGGIGSSAVQSGDLYAGSLGSLGIQAPKATEQYTGALSGIGSAAQNSGNAYAGHLAGLGGYAGTATNDYQATLRDTAQGRYLNANPYLDRTYDAAADGVTRAYQTATAPQSDSQFERAGRYGSGAMANATHQNQLDLGDTLNKLATDIYGKNYATERGYMNDAAEGGGKLALSSIDTGLKGYGAAAEAANQGYNTGLQANTDAGKLALSGIDTGIRAYDAAGKTANAGYGTGVDALRASASTDLGNLASQYQGLAGLQSGYETGNKATLAGLGLTGDVLKAQTYGLDTSLAGAKGLQDYGQAAVDEPWTRLNRLAALLGNPVTGSSETSKPIYGPNTLTSLLGTGSGLLGLGKEINSAFAPATETSSGGFLSGLGSAFLK